MNGGGMLRAAFLVVPLALAGLLLFPLRGGARVAVSIVAAVVVALALVAFVSPGHLSYLVSFSTMAAIYAILCLGLNCQWGYTGHLNFGIAGFFAVGAFTTALFTTAAPTGIMTQYAQQAFGLQMPFLVGVAAAAIVSGLLGLLVALAVLRLRVDFLAIATLGIAEIIRLVFQNERWLANGPQPLRGIPQPLSCLLTQPKCTWLPGPLADVLGALQPRDYGYLYLVVVSVFLALIYVALERAVRSPWGRVLRAIRDEEASAAMSGKYVTKYRIQSFVLGSCVMGIGGAIYAHYLVTIGYDDFQPLFTTFLVWVMLIFGGSGNNRGALLGAFVIWGVWTGSEFLAAILQPAVAVVSPELAARSAYIRWLLVGLLLIGIVLHRPQGMLREDKVVSDFLRHR